jgi:hypothetical protein
VSLTPTSESTRPRVGIGAGDVLDIIQVCNF